MTASLAEILFLIFGWIFAVKGLVIASLVISAFWLIVALALIGMGRNSNPKANFVMGIEFICIILSIVCLCIRF
jgi:hypothetical protein